MRSVRIVTDSNADIPPEIASELGIAVVPNYVYFGQEAIRDGIDLTRQAFFVKLAGAACHPRTTHPPVGEFVSTYQQMTNGSGSEAVISIHVASTVSGTLNAAWAAAQMLPHPSQVEIIDSGQLSMGLGWVVIKAAELAKDGASRTDVVEAIRSLLPRLRVVAMIDTLDNLVRGGRISQFSAVLGTALQVKPLLTIRSGQVSILGRVRTRARALTRLVEQVQGWGPLAELAVMHAGAEKRARTLAEALRGMAVPRILVAPAGSAITAHLGLGAVGACGLLEGND
jgi:DegV family protein with EDD domain